MSSSRLRLFVGCAPGLEQLLRDDVAAAWSHDSARCVAGGVELLGPREALWSIVRLGRCAELVRVRIGQFDARTFAELESGLERVPFHAWIRAGEAVDVRTSARRSRLYHTGAVSERVRRHLEKHRDVVEGTAQRVSVRVASDTVTVSVDATGADHHRHGERAAVGKASLRETLGAAMARALGPTPAPALWDPFCGAGTTLLETDALWRRRPIPAGEPPLTRWPTHDASAWEAWSSSLAAATGPPTPTIGSDTDARELDAASQNAQSAGLTMAQWVRGDFAAAVDRVPPGAAVVSNTPYGHRAGRGHDLAGTFRRLGDVLRAREDLERVVVLAGWRGFTEATGCRWETIATMTNRGRPVAMLRLTR